MAMSKIDDDHQTEDWEPLLIETPVNKAEVGSLAFGWNVTDVRYQDSQHHL
jgi:hypothetical protein